MKKLSSFLLLLSLVIFFSCHHNNIKQQDDLIFQYKPRKVNLINSTQYHFEGYTEHWDKYDWSWDTYAGIFDMTNSTAESDLWQMEMAQGNQLLLEELWIQPGFINNLHNSECKTLNIQNLTLNILMQELNSKNIILVGTIRDSLIKKMVLKLPQDLQYHRTQAFMLNYGKNNLYVISSQTIEEAEKLHNYITSTLDIISKYKLYKGWAGVRSHFKLITQHVHSPYTLIDRALKLGCSWLMLNGYNDYMLIDPASKGLSDIKLPFVLIPGQYGTGGMMYGTKTFPDVQDNTEIQCLDWMQKNNGYFFGNLSNMKSKTANRYSGYLINSLADKAKLDSLKDPFLTDAGSIDRQMPPSMILFLKQSETLSQSSVMKAIEERRSVALFPKADIYGDAQFTNALRILLLDRDYLESELLSPSSVKTDIKDDVLNVEFVNYRENPVKFNYKLLLPPSVSLAASNENGSLALGSCQSNTIHFTLNIKPDACGKELPIGVEIDYPGKHRPNYSLCLFDIPPAIEANQLMFDLPGNIDYPVTIFNYTTNKKVDVKLEIKSQNSKLQTSNFKLQTIDIDPMNNKTINFPLTLKEGDYVATVSALGLTHEGNIAIREEKGSCSVHTEDMNNDGIPEIVLENSKIRATVLLFGGRVIEYILKERNQNLLFKLWPQRPPWDPKPEGRRAFYPYGGLEEFIGYPTIEGHIVFNYKILKIQGDYARVKVWADIHGSKIEKIISLYGNSELLEVRYAFSDMDNNIRIIGINPLIRLGKSTGPEDTYYFPDISGKIEKRHPVLDRYYGNTFHLREGWAAGTDSIEKLSLLVGYPVNAAEIFHLWNNHPNNFPTPYYYTELQPWIMIKHNTTNYFTYYLMGREGNYQPILSDFRKFGLVTTIK